MRTLVTYRDGVVEVDSGKVIAATSDEARVAAEAVIRIPQIEQASAIDGETIIEGVRRLKPGTVENDRLALSKLPDAVLLDAEPG